MKKLTYKQKLELIEYMVSEDFIYPSITELKDVVYRVAHLNGNCKVHRDWEIESYNNYIKLKNENI